MKSLIAVAAAVLVASPAAAQTPAPLTLEQTMLLRCSAAFAIGAAAQQRGDLASAGYPPLAQRGREYFVRASARLMDELKLTREEIAARLRGEVAAQQQAAAGVASPKAYADSVMQPCLVALEASGL
ncbi:MAG: hypothetical protein ABIP41_03400 [Croceibacterium sp.]